MRELRKYWTFVPAGIISYLHARIFGGIYVGTVYVWNSATGLFGDSRVKMRPRREVPDSQLQEFVHRLLKINRPEADTPVMISSTEGNYCSSVGRLLEHQGARVSALVDNALQRERPVTVFLPENAYFAEVVSCEPQGEQFTVELLLIQHRSDSA